MTDTLVERGQSPLADHERGTLLLVPGPSDAVYRLHRGLVRLHAVDDEGNALTMRYVKPVGFFGEEAIAGAPRSVFAEAVTDVRVERIAPDDLTPRQRSELAIHLADAMSDLYRGLHRLATKRLRARVAAELLALGDSALADPGEDGPVVRVTHDALASSVGSVRETVTKVVGELARLGAVDAGYGRIRLRDARRLREVADGP
jgi:CRP-like cAMP-binding protein